MGEDSVGISSLLPAPLFSLPNYRDDSSLCGLFLRSVEIERVKGLDNF